MNKEAPNNNPTLIILFKSRKNTLNLSCLLSLLLVSEKSHKLLHKIYAHQLDNLFENDLFCNKYILV